MDFTLVIALGLLAAILAGGLWAFSYTSAKEQKRSDAHKASRGSVKGSAAENASRDPEVADAMQPPPQLPIPDPKPARLTFENTSGTIDMDSATITGVLRNNSGDTIRRLWVQYEVQDRSGKKVGDATAYLASLGPHETWEFKAVYLGRNADKYTNGTVRFERD